MLNQKQKPISGNKELNRSVYMTNCTSQFVKIIKTKPTLPVILFYYIMILTSYVVLILKIWSPQIALFSEIFVTVFLFRNCTPTDDSITTAGDSLSDLLVSIAVSLSTNSETAAATPLGVIFN